MDKIFTLKNYKIVSLILAFLFLFFGIFKVIDITKFSIEALPTPNIPALIIGIVFLAVSIIIYFEVGIDIFNLNTIKIKSLKSDGLSVKIERACINILFCKIEEVEKKDDAVVVLPANEYFDDECIKDQKSSLGAYVDKHFKNQISEFQKIVADELSRKNVPMTEQNKKDGEGLQNSYGIGTCVLLEKPINTSEKVLLVSVTEQRAGLGLYSNISFVYKAVSGVYKKATDNRIRNIYVPLLGSGHGGLNKRIALLSLVTAFTELMEKDRGNKIQTLNIVIYKNGKDIDIERKIVRKILKFGVGLAVAKDNVRNSSTNEN
jgi:O-acetyl-ADP-ribose deacetylase (regulator of RNase III)